MKSQFFLYPTDSYANDDDVNDNTDSYANDDDVNDNDYDDNDDSDNI